MTIIVADTTSGLPYEQTKKLGIPMISQQVIFGEETYQDGMELNSDEFLQKLKASANLPKTAAPLHSLYFPIFSQAAQTGETVLVIAPTGKMSGTVRSAETAKQDFPQVDIRIIDTQTIAGCLGSLVLEAHSMRSNGKNADEIENAIRSFIPRARTFFVVDTLEYLQKGGRIGSARALLGKLLQIKPILQVKDGQAAAFDQERTKKKAIARLIDLACEQILATPDPHLCVMHIDAETEADSIRSTLRTRLNISDIPLYLLPPAIIVHAGPKTLAIGFFA